MECGGQKEGVTFSKEMSCWVCDNAHEEGVWCHICRHVECKECLHRQANNGYEVEGARGQGKKRERNRASAHNRRAK